jgi:uncharacterized protein YkwD
MDKVRESADVKPNSRSIPLWPLCLVVLLAALASCRPYSPNLAVHDIVFKDVQPINQYRADIQLWIQAQNYGTEFPYNGELVFYRGGSLVETVSFGKKGPSSAVNMYVNVSENCWNTLGHSGYVAKLEYDPAISAPPEDIDAHYDDNEVSMSPEAICAKISSAFIEDYRSELLSLVNQYRQSNGKSPLTLDSCLNTAAQGHSDWMHENNVFSHIGKDNSSWPDRCAAAGCSCSKENIYEGSMAPDRAFKKWKGSPPHNAAMLGGYTKAGIGIAYGDVTMDFQ